MIETERFLESLKKTWAFLKRAGKHFLDTNFDSWEDIFCFFVLIGGFIVILITFMASAYLKGFDVGETEGLIRGFASGTSWITK